MLGNFTIDKKLKDTIRSLTVTTIACLRMRTTPVSSWCMGYVFITPVAYLFLGSSGFQGSM